MQDQSQLPRRIQNQMANVRPRDFMQPSQTQVFPQRQQHVPPPPPAPTPTIDQFMQMPEVQERINAIVEGALAQVAPPAAGIRPEALYPLVQLSDQEVPGDKPKSNSGGRLNAYSKGREEVITHVKEYVTAILGANHGEPQREMQNEWGLGAGEQAVEVGAPSGNAGDGQVPNILRQGNPSGM